MSKIDYLRKNNQQEKTAHIVIDKEKSSDMLDVIDKAISVHELPENHYQLSENQVLAEYPAELNQFIVKEQVLAGQVYNYFHDESKQEAREILKLMKSEMEAYSIVHRNKKSNPIVMGLIKRINEEEIPEPEKQGGIIGKFKKLLGLGTKEENEKQKKDK